MSGTDWEFYTQCGDAWKAMYDACAAAEKTIDFEQYIFRARKIGRKFLKLFEQKAKEGVKIRLFCDMMGSFGFYVSPERWRLKQCGIELIFYNPIRPWKLFCECGLFPRDHRKIAVIDGEVAFTGGVCIDERMRFWRDTHIRVTGEVVKEFQYTFDSIWENTLKDGCRASIPRYKGEKENMLYLNAPTSEQPVLRDIILERLERAEKRVLIATPYFVPADNFTKRICALVQKGVEVSIMTSAYSNIVSYCLGRDEAGKFLKHGARYLMYRKAMLHAKTIVIDDDFAAVGSFNVDNLSFYRNQEADLVSHDPEMVTEMRRQFTEDMKHCREMTLEQWENRRWYERAFARCFYLIKSYL